MHLYTPTLTLTLLAVSMTAEALSPSYSSAGSVHGKSLAPGRYRHFGKRLPVVVESRAAAQDNGTTLDLSTVNITISPTVNASLIKDISELQPHLTDWASLSNSSWLKKESPYYVSPGPAANVSSALIDVPATNVSVIDAPVSLTNISIPVIGVNGTSAQSINSSSVLAPAASALPSPSTTTITSNQTSIPSSSSTKQVYVHHMIGNTFPYKLQDWSNDVRLASESRLDGFALNLGTDVWQAESIAMAYAAAQAFSPNFKLFISFDMTIFPCTSSSDGATVLNLAARYATHPNQATYKDTGRPLMSTFGGSECSFGESDWGKGFDKVLKQPLLAQTSKEMFFIPSVFSDPSTFQSVSVMDGELNWNSGWPLGQEAISFARDETYLAQLGEDKAYVASVSPGFYTHYAPNSWNKNWLYLSDGFLFAKRWELLVQQRDRFDLVEALTWNDYGESSYIGPIQGAQPNSQAWVDGLDHEPLLEINNYYATAFKTGSYPTIKKSKIFLQARPHSAGAVASNDDCGSRPTGGQNGPADGYLWTADKAFALVMAASPSKVVMTSGSASSTFDVPAGVTFLESDLLVGHGIDVTLTPTSGQGDGIHLAPKFTFIDNPVSYNYNYHFWSSS